MWLKVFEIFFFISLTFGISFKNDLKFPDDFEFGVATASYQVEGAWNYSDKGKNIWDELTHNHPELIVDHSTGDVACDSFHLWQTDIENLKNLGVGFYRFSLSWTRILPTGFPNYISQTGVKYYNNLIDGLIKNNIKPMVTLYHWDLPQTLQDIGGWPNDKISDYFADYTRVVFNLFGDRVKLWITINEPASICEDTYDLGIGAPPVRSPGIGNYLCGKTILLAHAKAAKIYNEEFKKFQNGKIGITIDSSWLEPISNSTEDVGATNRGMQMMFGWWTNPIFSKKGNYPPVMIQRIKERSSKEKFPFSRLPLFSLEEISLLVGSADFLGLNHYTTYFVKNIEYPIGQSSLLKDMGIIKIPPPNGARHCPWGFRKLINWIKHQYGDIPIYITENGIPDKEDLRDKVRVSFLKNFMRAVLQAVVEDGCNVKGYTAWSLMDNMEWRDGYT